MPKTLRQPHSSGAFVPVTTAVVGDILFNNVVGAYVDNVISNMMILLLLLLMLLFRMLLPFASNTKSVHNTDRGNRE